MRTQKFLEVLYTWPKVYMFGTDLAYLFTLSADARFSKIKRTVQEGVLIPLRRDLYLISRPDKRLPNTFELASLIYGPSYISLESALSFHGWIPESVPSTTSVSTKRGKSFETTLGIFSYQHIPFSAFPLGVKEYSGFFLADPWKALADYMYVKKKSWPTLQALSEDLRIDTEVIKQSDKELLSILAQEYPSPRVRKTLNILFQDFELWP